MLANMVSPPTGGTVMLRSNEPIAGTRVKDMSECQTRPVYLESDGWPLGLGSLVTINSSGYSGWRSRGRFS